MIKLSYWSLKSFISGLKFNPDPTVVRVILVAVLMMSIHIVTKLIEILSTGRQPSAIELELFGCEGVLILMAYLLAFLQKGET